MAKIGSTIGRSPCMRTARLYKDSINGLATRMMCAGFSVCVYAWIPTRGTLHVEQCSYNWKKISTSPHCTGLEGHKGHADWIVLTVA